MESKVVGIYTVYSDGRIVNTKRNKEVKASIVKDYLHITFYLGYKRTRLNKYVHRIIAEAFIPNPLNKPQINHKNGNKLDNRVENLEWCTSSENIKHTFDVLGRKGYSWRKLSDEQAVFIRQNGSKGNNGNVAELCKKFQVSRGTVLNIINRERYKNIA